jgi:ornithine carbamoyltransferase
MKSQPRHFLDISSVDKDSLKGIIASAHDMKSSGTKDKPLEGKMLAMIFDKPSTRTRVSFDVGMRQLGGETIILSGSEMQLGRGETVADTAKVLSRYVDAIMIRTTDHDRVLELAENATVPVINGLTDDTHPCQIMADVLTIEEKLGSCEGKKVVWTGDGNNVLNSLIEASSVFNYELDIAVPKGHEPDDKYMQWAKERGSKINLGHDAKSAVKGADCVVTDTWTSMGFEGEASGHNTFMPYQVNDELMAKANDSAIFMHCLPAHRGEEVTDSVMDGVQSVVFDEAENRLHAQKAILAWCLNSSN